MIRSLGGALMNGMSALLKEAPKSSLSLLPCEREDEEGGPADTGSASGLTLDFPDSRTVIINSYCWWVTQCVLLCYSSLNRWIQIPWKIFWGLDIGGKQRNLVLIQSLGYDNPLEGVLAVPSRSPVGPWSSDSLTCCLRKVSTWCPAMNCSWPLVWFHSWNFSLHPDCWAIFCLWHMLCSFFPFVTELLFV